MAYKVSNINDLFRVKSDGAIEFGTSGAGTATYVLTSAGPNATPTWTEPTTGTVTGSGLENRVARWTADGSDIGNGPITFSAATAAANSTFGGNVLIPTGKELIIGSQTTAESPLGITIRDNQGDTPVGIVIHNENTGSASDAQIAFETQGALDFSIGIDKSDSNKFVMSRASVLGTNNVFTIDGTTATFSGDVGLGGTGLYTNTVSLNIDGTGLAIKNDTAGSSNNWSTIKNTATLSSSNIVFVTGVGTSLTLNHDKSATFTGDITIDKGTGGNAKINLIESSGGTQNAAIEFDQAGENTLYISTNYISPSDSNKILLQPGSYPALTASGGVNGSINSKVQILGTLQADRNIQTPNSDLSSTAAPTNFGVYTSEIRLIETPNGGLKQCRVITDNYGEWILVGRFAASAKDKIQGVWSSESGLDTSTSQSTTTKFSADFGDSYPTEVRIMGATDFTKWRDTRTVDFIYGVPEGRQWKFFFSGGVENGMAVSGKYGWGINGAYDGFGRWVNPAQNFVRMSDMAAVILNPSAAYTTATTDAFDWNTNDDAKFSVSATRVFSGQDNWATVAVGADDGGPAFFDAYPSEIFNNAGSIVSFSSSVWVLIKLPNASSGGGGGGGYWAANGNDIYNTNSANVGIGTSSPDVKLDIEGTGGEILRLRDTDGSYTALTLYNDATSTNSRNWGIFNNGYNYGDFNIVSSTTNTGDPDITNATRLTITKDGSVGIGTEAPSSILDIVDTSTTPTKLTIGVAGEVPVISAGGANTDLRIQAVGAGGFIDLNTGATSTTRMRIDSVGLATFSSTYIDATSYGGEVTVGGSSTVFGLQLKYDQFSSTISTLYHSPGYTNDSNLFKLGSGSGNTNQLVLKGDGNVGIGTASPDAKLNISKTSFSTTFTSADSYIRIGKGENAEDGYQFIGFGYNNGSADLVPAYIGYQQTGTPGNYTKGDLVFGTRNVTTNTVPTERMRIDSAGNVGIGATAVTEPGFWYDATNKYLAISHWATPPTPAALLHLSDNANDIDVPQIRIEGRENPGDTKLDISVTDPNARFNLQENTGDANAGYGLMIFKTNAVANASFPARGGFNFQTPAATSSLFITNQAKVGIGTSSPIEKLQVVGQVISTGSNSTSATAGAERAIMDLSGFSATDHSARFGHFRGTNSAGAGQLRLYTDSVERVRINATGNVGIGVTGPTGAKLEVKKDHGNTWVADFHNISADYQGVRIRQDSTSGSGGPGSNGNSALVVDDQRANNMVTPTPTVYIKRSGANTNGLLLSVEPHGNVGLTVNDGGRVGIGTEAPDAKLEVDRPTYTSGTGIANFINGNNPIRVVYDTVVIAQTDVATLSLVETVTGAQATEQKLTFAVGDNNAVIRTANTSGGMWFNVNASVSAPAYQTSGGTNAIRILNSGNVGILDSTPSYELDVDGTIRATGDIIAYSDVRVKENIKTIDNSLEKVSKLRGVEFNKIGKDEKSIGVIAQEIEKVIPEVVREDEKGMKSVAYGNISGLLIEAIKELKAEIEEIKKCKCDCKR